MRASEIYETAVEDLKNRLPKLKSHTYNSIDNLMQDISFRHRITGKKLHDLFVRKYGHTPDTWIKKLKDRLGEEGVAEDTPDQKSLRMQYPNYYQTRDSGTIFRTQNADGQRMDITPDDEEWDDYYKQQFKDMPTPNDNGGFWNDDNTAAYVEDWNKVNKKDKTSGMSQKAVNAYRRENPGSKLKTAVTTKPSKLKKGSKAANRRKSFCARMGGNKGPMKKPNGKPTPKALALRRWNCESVEELQELVMLAEQKVAEAKNLKQQAAIAIAKKKSVTEMDKSQTPPGRDGGNDKASKKEYAAKIITPKKVTKDGEKMINRIFKDTPKKKVSESVDNADQLQQIKDFINWSMKTLNMQKPYPKFTLSRNTQQAQKGHHTGLHHGDTIWVYIENRNLVDIFRTIFHELVHHRQDQLDMIKDGDSYPGSPIEALADMMAGKYIKIYGKEHPEIFQ